MSTLEGDLNSQSVQRVLQTLIKRNPASTWLISDGKNEKVIYFSTGGVRLYASPGRNEGNIDQHLLRNKLVPKDVLDLAVRDQQRSNEDLIDILERLECLPRDRFHKVVEEMIYLELCNLVTWEGAIFEYYEGNPPPEIFDQDHPAVFASLDVPTLAEGIQEWAREWSVLKAKLYSERLCPQLAVDNPDERPDLPAVTRRLCRAIDGQRDLRELSRFVKIEFPEVARAIYGAVQEGLVRGSLVSEKDPTTPQEVLDEIEKLEAALEKAINTLLIHKRIATNYEKIGDVDAASEHYNTIADLQADRGRISEALQLYRRAFGLCPQNFEAHQALIRLLQKLGNADQALNEIFNLGKKLVSFGFVKQAYDRLVGVVAKERNHFELRVLFADILARLGRVPEAVAELLGLAREKQRSGSLDGVDELYRKILALDPVNKEARQGLVTQERRQTGKLVVWMHRLASTAAILTLAAWLGMEGMARASWSDSESTIRRAAQSGRPQEGYRELRAFCANYPTSLVSERLLPLEEEFFRDSFYELEAEIDKADRLWSSGKVRDARQILRKVKASSLVASQSDRAGERAREAAAYIKRWKKVRDEAERLVAEKHYEEAFGLSRKIIETYPEGAQGLRLPFFVRTEPAGCYLQLDGVPMGPTPRWLVIRYGENQEVQLEGPSGQTMQLDGLDDHPKPFVTVSVSSR